MAAVPEPTPMMELLLAAPGARLAVVVAGTTGAEEAYATEEVRGVPTTHRREVVDLDLAARRLDGRPAAPAVLQLRNESAGAPLVVDVWRDAAGMPLRIVVPYPRASGVGYLLADFAEPGLPVALPVPASDEVAWSVVVPAAGGARGAERSSSFAP